MKAMQATIRYVLTAISVFALALCLTACSARTSITQEQFTSAMEELGWAAREIDASTMEQASALGVSVYLAYSNGESSSAVYHLFESGASAQEQYATMVASMKAQSITISREVNSSTYNRLEAEAGGSKVVMLRNENTLVTISGEKDIVIAALQQLQ